jgi:thioredoxin 1
MSGQSNSKLVEATDATFQSEVLESQIPVVVDFFTPTCGPCRFIKPLLEKLAEEYDGKVKVVTVNVAEHGERFFALGGHSVPLVVAYHCGNEISRKAGTRPYSDFKTEFQALYERSLTETCPSAVSQTADATVDGKEANFASAVEAADRAFFAKAGPASERFENEIEPDQARFESAKIDAANKLSDGAINQEEHDALAQAAVQRFIADTAAAKQRLMDVVTPAEAERAAAIEAARKLFAQPAEG